MTPGLPQTHYAHRETAPAIWDLVYTLVFNMLGLSAIAVPTGLDAQGYPTSVQIAAGRDSEWLLIRVAQEMSAKFGGWRAAHTNFT